MNIPPEKIDDAKVLLWAILDDEVTYTGKVVMNHDGKVIDSPRAFALCQYEDDPTDYLVFYCNENWETLAAAGYDSIDQAKSKIERGFSGITSKWRSHA